MPQCVATNFTIEFIQIIDVELFPCIYGTWKSISFFHASCISCDEDEDCQVNIDRFDLGQFGGRGNKGGDKPDRKGPLNLTTGYGPHPVREMTPG